MATHPNFCISRIDNPSSHGWMVRIKRGDTKVFKFFSDANSGGKRLAQEVAKNFRDENLVRLNREGKTPHCKKIVFRQKRNKSGHIGISKVNKKRPDGRLAPYYAVTWHPKPGVQRGTTVSIEKYGEAGALKRAVAIRNRQMMRRFGSGVFRKIKAMKAAAGEVVSETQTDAAGMDTAVAEANETTPPSQI